MSDPKPLRSFIRAGHGNGVSRPHIELASDEPSTGMPAPAAPSADAEREIQRKPDGTPADREAAALLGKISAKRRAERRAAMGGWLPRKLRIGGHALFEVKAALVRFAAEAEAAYDAKCQEIARDVGGGVCGVGVSACLRQWAHAHYGSLAMFELATGPLMFDPTQKDAPKLQAELMATAARLSAEARGALLTAHSLAAEEARARAVRAASSDDITKAIEAASRPRER